jgi:hypothetical protein
MDVYGIHGQTKRAPLFKLITHIARFPKLFVIHLYVLNFAVPLLFIIVCSKGAEPVD